MGVAVLKARLVESHEIAPEIKHFTFDVPEVEQLPYLPGQFVSFSHDFGDKKLTRAYSTASPPNANRFELCLNRVQDGLFSPYLFEMKPGDTVEMKGPLGYFTWKYPQSDSILVATGPEGNAAVLKNDWNELTASVHGRRIVFGVNGTKTVDLQNDTAGRMEGHLALQAHGSKRDTDVWFKDIELLAPVQ